jgi:hypothetical protein
VSGSRRRVRGAAVVACGTAVVLAGCSATSGTTAAVDLDRPLMSVGTAAAPGAGDAATEAMVQDAVAGATELGRVAAVMTDFGKPQSSLARSWTWDGWRSGASGEEAADGSFGTWRGKPVEAVSVWCDGPASLQTNMDAVDRYRDYRGDMDVAVGGLVRGETWKQAAAGRFAARWTKAMRTLRAKRLGKGTTYVRIAHEMNGDWMAWGMNSKSLKDYIKGYRLYASIVRKEFPEARLSWSPNGGNHTDVSTDKQYPGDDVVDVVAPDIYDGWPDTTSAAIFRENAKKWLTPESPTGIIAWQIWAERRGKPLGMPEWGIIHGDHPDFVIGVHSVMSQHPGLKGKVSNAGRFVYDVYFNADDEFKLLGGANPKAAAAYKARTWGN